jgi:Secretion system C-terminal sorting domain
MKNIITKLVHPLQVYSILVLYFINSKKYLSFKLIIIMKKVLLSLALSIVCVLTYAQTGSVIATPAVVSLTNTPIKTGTFVITMENYVSPFGLLPAPIKSLVLPADDITSVPGWKIAYTTAFVPNPLATAATSPAQVIVTVTVTQLNPSIPWAGGLAVPNTITGDLFVALTTTATALFPAAVIVQATTPLAVELKSFEAKADAGTSVINWTTSNERNNAMFSIERSLDGVIFAEIGTVKGAGTTSVEQNYNFIDAALPNASMVYYRLKDVTTNGKETYSKAVAVSLKAANRISVIAVSASADNVHVQFDNGQEELVVLTVYNLTGQAVYSKTVSTVAGYNSLDVSEITNNGIYILNLRSATGTVSAKFGKF